MTNCPERRTYLASALLIPLLNGTTAPVLATEASDGLWTVFTSTDAFHSDAASSRWHYWFDAQARYFDLGVVPRVLAKYVRPLGVDCRRYFLVGLEPFVDLRDTDWSGDAGLGQNRVSLGISWRIDENFAFEAGYMNHVYLGR